jgi:uncharacterized protein YggE
MVCALSINTYAQSAGNYLYNNGYSVNTDRATVSVNTPAGNNISLKAEVMMNVTPTSYTAIFAATQTGKDVYEVDSLMALRIDQIRYALGLLGISNEDIHIDAVAMVPAYAQKLEEKKFSKRSTEVPIGFEMKKNIHILFRNHELLESIISELAFADVYDLVKVEYNIDGVQTYYEQLRQAALSVIQTKEATYAALKMHIDVYSIADGFNSSYPMERYKSYTAYNSGTSYHAVTAALNQWNNIYVEGKGNTVRMDGYPSKDVMNQQFIVQTAEKNKTIFYDRMPYNQFDKVINADTEEPCIQLYYSLTVNYSMITEEQYQKNKEQIEYQKKLQEQQLALQQNNGKRAGRRRR